MTISKRERAYTEALMLAITAPSQELSDECTLMATQIGNSLTNKQRELARMGIEVALEYAL